RFVPQFAGNTAAAAAADRQARARRVLTCRVCGGPLMSGVDRKLGRCATCPSDRDEQLYERLRHWRRTVATEQDVPAYVVFTDATLAALAERKPTSSAELAAIPGIGPRKLELYGAAVLALVAGRSVPQITNSTPPQ